jgi:hypothetical protein
VTLIEARGGFPAAEGGGEKACAGLWSKRVEGRPSKRLLPPLCLLAVGCCCFLAFLALLQFTRSYTPGPEMPRVFFFFIFSEDTRACTNECASRFPRSGKSALSMSWKGERAGRRQESQFCPVFSFPRPRKRRSRNIAQGWCHDYNFHTERERKGEGT